MSSKRPSITSSARPRDVILGTEKQSGRKRRQHHYREMEYGESYRDTAARLKTMSMANGGQAIYDLVPHRKSSKAFQARREGGRVETAQLQQTCRLQNERLQDKRVELRALRHERHNLESKTSALEGENVALAERRQELEARIALLETQTTELRRENTVLATRRKELEGRTAALEDEKMQLVGQKDELNTELVISNLDERGMLDDGVVKVRWAGLENVIFNIAVQRFGVPPGPGTPPEPVEVFEGLVAEPGEWLRDAARREWLIQAFLWKELVETVLGEYGFSARSYNLSGDNRRVYSDYLKALRGECSRPGGITRLQYQKLKAAMNMVLAPVKELNRKHITKVAREMEESLLPFQTPGVDVEACPPFEDLVFEAAQLDADMAKCRAWYEISMYDFDRDDGTGRTWEEKERDGDLQMFHFDFDDKTMQDAMGSKGDKVLLVVSPMLVKWGDLDGKNFDASRVLARRAVITE